MEFRKLHNKSLVLLMAVIAVVACKKSKEPPAPQLSVSSSEELFVANGGTSEVTVSSNTKWSIANSASWCTAIASER